jgi:type IV secretory pathway VirB10-like protein
MAVGQRLLTGALLLALAGCGWLYRENWLLRNQIDALNHQTAVAVVPPGDAEKPAPDRQDTAPAAADDQWRFAQRPRPALPPPAAEPEPKTETEPEPETDETRAERRQRRQNDVAAMFGRLDGETEEEYRARMVPFLQTALLMPRQHVGEARRRAEEAAKVTGEQRAALDRVFADVHAEALALTNRALAEGEITPYRRNWAGALGYAGGVGAILGSAEARVGEILGPEQQRILYEQGFEWGEYLAVTVPWEQLQPPPPSDR